MQIYGMIIGDELKYVGLKKSSVQKMVDHQKEVYKFPIHQKRDSNGRFIKSN
jgi:hypothetical protein